MQNNKLLAALCYFSVFLAPLLIPIIIYFASNDREIKHHAKRSLISHLIPVVLLIAGIVIFSYSMFSFTSSISGIPQDNFGIGFWQLAPFLFSLIYGLLFITVMIWNIFQGVKVLR